MEMEMGVHGHLRPDSLLAFGEEVFFSCVFQGYQGVRQGLLEEDSAFQHAQVGIGGRPFV